MARAKKDYKWDVGALKDEANMLRKQLELLEKQKEELITLKNEFYIGMKGDAASSFDEDLEADIDVLGKICKELRKQCDDLDKVIKNCYSECENKLKAGIKKVRENVM